MKNGMKTLSFVGCCVKLSPFSESIENPVIIHGVIVSGTVLMISFESLDVDE